MSRSPRGLTHRTHTREDGTEVERAWYDRVLPRIGRVAKALGCDADSPRAAERAAALNTLVERGSENVIARWRDSGRPSITDIVRAVREGDYRSLRLLDVHGPTLGEGTDDFIERAENTLNARTVAQYTATLNQLVEHFGADTPMASIRTEDAEAFLYAPKKTTGDRPWSRSTQGDARTICKALWAFVVQRDREAAEHNNAVPNVVLNPWRAAKVGKRTKTRHAYLLPDEWTALIAHERVAGTPKAALLGLACLAGLRRGEICNLRTPYDVDLEAGVIEIQPHPGEWEWYPKGWTDGITNSVRTVPIVPALMEILRAHVERRYAGARFFIHGQWHDRPLGETTALDWTRDALTAAGLTYGRDDEDSLTLHSLRHTYATWMVSDGVPVPTVARLMGNTPEVVLSTYAHHIPDDDERAIESIQGRVS